MPSLPLCAVVAIVCLFAGLLTAQESVTKVAVELKSGWQFRQHIDDPNSGAWRPAQVPGDVHLDLLQNKLIPDPFYRDNEAKLQWIENVDWEYHDTFSADQNLLQHKNIELVFDGLDAYAQVSLNGKLILTADNMFRQWRVDIKPYLHTGANELLVVFPSPIRQAADIAGRDKWHVKAQIEDKTYIRKAAYEYGWDWGPRFVTSGIWRPVRIECWDEAKISDLHIRQRDVNAASAHLNAEVEITASSAHEAIVSVESTHHGKSIQAATHVELQPGVNHILLPIDIRRPELWYPAGYGAQPIYTFNAQVKIGAHLEDRVLVKTGIRSVVLRREPDQWGRSFEFIVNGIPIFAKGADVIPFDSFPSRATAEQYRRVLQSARDANMNMVRHWGGGYYETQEFYDLCDELGIMVWQDFMFGNDWQPGTYAFKQSMAKEAEYQVKRLRDHPSIVIWCGNNETEEAFNWADRGKLEAETRRKMWEDYLTSFSGVLDRIVARYAPETPYWPSSPSSDYEEISDAYQSGDMHDWSVWHGRVPFADYEKHFPRFMTEFGFQSFPEMRTIEAFTQPEDRANILTPVMLSHQKNNEGNALIHDYLLRYYTEPKDFASFLYVSQVLQAEGIKIGAEHLRRQRPRTMGSIFWQLNDCWPVASWSSIDYYGRWKALQYYAKRFYSDLLVSPHLENGIVAVYVVSDRVSPISATLRVRLMTIGGRMLREQTQNVELPALSSRSYLRLPLSELLQTEGADPSNTFVEAQLSTGGVAVSRNLLFFVAPKYLKLQPAPISTELTRVGDSYRLRLQSKVLARNVSVSFGNIDATLTDDYFDLVPEEPVDITVNSAATLDQLRTSLKTMSLADAFGPSEMPASILKH